MCEYRIHAWFQYAAEGSPNDGYVDLGPAFSSRQEAVDYLEERLKKGNDGGWKHPDYWMNGEYIVYRCNAGKLTKVICASDEQPSRYD